MKSVLATSDRVEWIETTGDLYGTVKAYGALPAHDEATAGKNPMGLYLTQTNCSRLL